MPYREAMPSVNEAIGVNLRRHRDRAGMLQGDLVAALEGRGVKVSLTTIGRYERGEASMPSDTLFACAVVLGVPPATLLQVEPDDELWVTPGTTLTTGSELASRDELRADLDDVRAEVARLKHVIERTLGTSPDPAARAWLESQPDDEPQRP